MKILIICDLFDESIGSQENILAKYFRKHGHQVTILTSTFESVFDFIADKYDRRKPGRTYHIDDLKVIRAPYRLNFLNRLRSFQGSAGFIEQENPDMIFMLDIMPDMLEVVRYKRRNPNCRFVMDYHADYSNSAKNILSRKILHGLIRKTILNVGLPYLDAIYPVTPASGDFLHEVYGVPTGRMELLPLGADMDLGVGIAERSEGRELRRGLGIPEGTTVIFSGGKFAKPKRTELLIEAVRRLGHLPLVLIIVGSANIGEENYADALRQAAAGDERIRFVGWLGNDDLFRFMDMADLAVFPASQSILWVQAVSMGLPLVVGNVGAQDTYYMNAHGNIIELPKADICADKLVEIIEQLVSNPRRLAEMRAGARRTFAEVLDWNSLIWKTIGRPAPGTSHKFDAACARA